MTAYHVVWRFETDPARQAAFEQAYASGGAWAEFFRTGEGYLGTELLRDPGGAPRYVTVDRWSSRAAYHAFRAAHAEEYRALDQRTGALTREETFLGEDGNVERYRRWYEYERDAHARALASLDTVPPGTRSSASFRKACGLLAHIIMARRLWLHRLGELDSPPTEFFPDQMPLPAIRAVLEDTEQLWGAYLARLTDQDITPLFTYRSQEGPYFRNRVEDILTQLFGHSWYHRGQIAQLVRELGGSPAATDFVFWCREPGADPAAPAP